MFYEIKKTYNSISDLYQFLHSKRLVNFSNKVKNVRFPTILGNTVLTFLLHISLIKAISFSLSFLFKSQVHPVHNLVSDI